MIISKDVIPALRLKVKLRRESKGGWEIDSRVKPENDILIKE